MKFLRIIFSVCIIYGFFTVNINQTVFAQGSFEPSDIVVDINPETPEPNKEVTISLNSYSISLDQMYIEWQEGNIISLAGYGEKTFHFTTGSIGETNVIKLTIKDKQDGSILYNKTIVTKPGDMDLLWQAVDSYVPPFYKGKILPTTEGLVKITALPSFKIGNKIVSPKNVVYQWRRNYNAIPEGSGYGKNVLSLKQSYLNNEEKIEVTATETTGGGVVKSSLVIKPYDPKIIFYEKDPLLGVLYNQGLYNSATLSRLDKTLIASPYFVSSKDPNNSDLTYTWSLNGSDLSTPSTPNQIVLRGTDQTGTATLNLLIESASKLFLSAKKSINLIIQ